MIMVILIKDSSNKRPNSKKEKKNVLDRFEICFSEIGNSSMNYEETIEFLFNTNFENISTSEESHLIWPYGMCKVIQVAKFEKGE